MAADPFFVLHQDHDVIRPKLRAFEAALDAAMNLGRAGPTELAAFREAVTFLRTTAFEHFRREEEALLAPLEAKVGRFGTLVNVIAYDHEEIRREVSKLDAALVALEGKAVGPHRAELHEVNRHGVFVVQYLGLHMVKEDSSLAEMARAALGEDGLREVLRRLEGTP